MKLTTPTKAELYQERDKLRDENAKLRHELDELQTHWELDHCPNCTARLDAQDLKAENAELRELLRKVIKFEREGCNGCFHWDGCDADTLYDPDCPMCVEIARDMHEQGIEVE